MAHHHESCDALGTFVHCRVVCEPFKFKIVVHLHQLFCESDCQTEVTS